MKTRKELKAEYPGFSDDWWDAMERMLANERERHRREHLHGAEDRRPFLQYTAEHASKWSQPYERAIACPLAALGQRKCGLLELGVRYRKLKRENAELRGREVCDQ